MMGAVCGIAAASGVSNAHPRAPREVGPPTACFDEAVLAMQMRVIQAQLDDESEAMGETLAVLESSKVPEDALMVKLQAQMENAEVTRRRARATAQLAAKVVTEAGQLGCCAPRGPSNS
jgi:hypothetical protein